jgi:hypothetical protein
MIFSPEEVSTLEALYPDKESWFQFFYILSDRVQEEDESMADGMRFLCASRQRPYFWTHDDRYWWCCIQLSSLETDSGPNSHRSKFENHLPPVAFGLEHWNTGHGSLQEALETFLLKWSSLPLNVRFRLWSEWVEAAHAGN